jgi:hypothetical protein
MEGRFDVSEMSRSLMGSWLADGGVEWRERLAGEQPEMGKVMMDSGGRWVKMVN